MFSGGFAIELEDDEISAAFDRLIQGSEFDTQLSIFFIDGLDGLQERGSSITHHVLARNSRHGSTDWQAG